MGLVINSGRQCLICQSSFKSGNALHIHIRTEHLVEGKTSEERKTRTEHLAEGKTSEERKTSGKRKVREEDTIEDGQEGRNRKGGTWLKGLW